MTGGKGRRPRGRAGGRSLAGRGVALRFRLAVAGALAGSSALLGLAPPGPPEAVSAAWQDQSFAAVTLRAGTVPPATLTAACRYVPGLLGLGAKVEIYWRPPPGYTREDAVLWASQRGLGSALAPLTGFNLQSSTVLNSSGTFLITTVPTNLLGGLLGLGSELQLSIIMRHPSQAAGWTSRPASIATNAGLVLGLGGNCRNL